MQDMSREYRGVGAGTACPSAERSRSPTSRAPERPAPTGDDESGHPEHGDAPRGSAIRDVSHQDLARILRAALGLPPHRPGLAEWVLGHQRHLPSLIRSVDVEAWLAWALAGLPLFAERLPSFRQARDAGTRVLLLVALARANGNISAVARSLQSSRKVVRDNMRRLGLHPWRRGDGLGSGHDADGVRV